MHSGYRVRVIRPWPGGPQKDAVVSVSGTRRDVLVRTGMVVPVVEGDEQEADRPTITLKRKSRHAALNG